MNTTKRILITGAAGAVGSVLVAGLRNRHTLRGFDLNPTDLEDTRIGTIHDFDAVLKAAEGMDAIIHLTGTDREWPEVMNNAIGGTYNVLEAARLAGVRRVVYASRAGLQEHLPQDVTRTVDQPLRPKDFYSVSKVFGEAIGYTYVHQFGLQFVSVRIGNFKRDRPIPTHPHELGHADAVRVFERAVLQEGISFEIVYGVSDSSWPLYDLNHGRRVIGYEPQQRSEWRPEAK